MMIGSAEFPKPAARTLNAKIDVRLNINELSALNDKNVIALNKLDIEVRAGEILGIAGVSGNGQRELVQVLAGQRPRTNGEILVNGNRYFATRDDMTRERVYCCPKNLCRMQLCQR